MSLEDDDLLFSEEDLSSGVEEPKEDGPQESELSLEESVASIMSDELKKHKKDSGKVLSIKKNAYDYRDLEKDLISEIGLPASVGSSQRTVEDPTISDSLFNSIKNNDPTITILNNIMQEMAEEAAYLKSFRQDNFDVNEDNFSEVSDKRVMTLRKIVEALDKREKILKNSGSARIDFRGEAFLRIFEHFLKAVKYTFKKVNIPDQYNDIFFSQLAKELDGFEDTAERLYNGKKVKQDFK